ncbi:hypothetical protein LXA43DRAFT_386938 [Ganoderma leucocontextum]|nr:hypothetical protein LXA43DRAFT_386938 [Ganoderma leucocontextum]
MVSLSAVSVFSTTSQAILYGYAVFMFMLAMWIVVRDRQRGRINYYMIVPGCLLLGLGTAEMAVNIARLYIGFISKGPGLSGGPDAYFADVTEPSFVAKSCLYNAQTIVLDAVVIYRTYVVWNNLLVCLLPIAGWFGLVATSIGLNVALASDSSEKTNVFAIRTSEWITSLLALTLATNLSSTGLLALKIWLVARQSAQYRSGTVLTRVLRVAIESGAIYSLTITTMLILFLANSDGVFVLLDMISPIIAIVFNMLIIRIGLAKHPSFPSSGMNNAGVSASDWAAALAERSHSGGVRRRQDGSLEMRDLKVEITQVIERETEYGGSDMVSSRGSFRPAGSSKAADRGVV